MTEQEPVPTDTGVAADGGAGLREDVAVTAAPVHDGDAPRLTGPGGVDSSLRSREQRSRTFTGVLVNTLCWARAPPAASPWCSWWPGSSWLLPGCWLS